MSTNTESAEVQNRSRPSTPLNVHLAHLSSVIIASSAEDTASGDLVSDEDTLAEQVDDPASPIAPEEGASDPESVPIASPPIPLVKVDGETTYFAYPDGTEDSSAVEPLHSDLAGAEISIAGESSLHIRLD
jgi:hypothetical protein